MNKVSPFRLSSAWISLRRVYQCNIFICMWHVHKISEWEVCLYYFLRGKKEWSHAYCGMVCCLHVLKISATFYLLTKKGQVKYKHVNRWKRGILISNMFCFIRDSESLILLRSLKQWIFLLSRAAVVENRNNRITNEGLKMISSKLIFGLVLLENREYWFSYFLELKFSLVPANCQYSLVHIESNHLRISIR